MQTKNLNPVVIFTILGENKISSLSIPSHLRTLKAIWEFQSRHDGVLPDDFEHAAQLESIASTLFTAADVNKVVKSIPRELIEYFPVPSVHVVLP